MIVLVVEKVVKMKIGVWEMRREERSSLKLYDYNGSLMGEKGAIRFGVEFEWSLEAIFRVFVRRNSCLHPC